MKDDNKKRAYGNKLVKKRTNKVRPFVRYFARMIDISVLGLVIGFSVGLYGEVVTLNEIIFGIIILFLWVFIEPIFLSTLGTTFGKWLLNIKVRDKKGHILNYETALKRSAGVWFFGLGMGIPIVVFFTQLFAYFNLKKTGITTWDKDLNLKVSHQEIGLIEIVVVILFIAFIIWGMIPTP